MKKCLSCGKEVNGSILKCESCGKEVIAKENLFNDMKNALVSGC